MPKVSTTPPDLRTQAGRIRWARERAGYKSIRGAAAAFDWNENTYKSHEQGMRGAEGIKTKHLKKYARAFKVSEAWLATGTGDPLKPDLTQEEMDIVRKALSALTGR